MSYPQHYKGSVPPRLICGWDNNNSLLREVGITENGYLYTSDVETCIATGCVSNLTPWVKTGFNSDVDIGIENVWTVGGLYIWPSTAMSMEVISSSTDDDDGGTGVNVITLTYLDASYEEQETDVTLNGTTAVAVPLNILRVNNFRAKTIGTGNKAAGNIDVRHVDDAPIYSRILAGDVRARNVAYTVPLGKTLYITSITFSVGGILKNVTYTAKFRTMANYDPVNARSLTFQMGFTEVLVQEESFYKRIEIPTKIIEKTDLITEVEAYTDNCITMCVYRGWLASA